MSEVSCTLAIAVVPNAPRSEVIGWLGDAVGHGYLGLKGAVHPYIVMIVLPPFTFFTTLAFVVCSLILAVQFRNAAMAVAERGRGLDDPFYG